MMNEIDSTPQRPVEVVPGVFKVTLGHPERITPVSVRRSTPLLSGFNSLPPARNDYNYSKVIARPSDRGFHVSLPFDRDEGIFGLGLQLKSCLHSGRKRHLRVNADPLVDTGDSHAPVPFFLSTVGYGVLVDTARYVSFYFGTHAPLHELSHRARVKHRPVADAGSEALYRSSVIGDTIAIDIPAAQGVDLYVFLGPTMMNALQRYNLFSGGGVALSATALGTQYRCHADSSAEDVLALVTLLKHQEMDISSIGLEPGWQTHFYPNSFEWNLQRFPKPSEFVSSLARRGLELNLWENAFVHPDCQLAAELGTSIGDQPATDGLVPDLLSSQGRDVFVRHHRTKLVPSGVRSFKLDECDNGDFLPAAWSFPEHTRFPSGADGEQMHCLLGVHYQHATKDALRETPPGWFGLARSSGALAASLPFALYSDLYDHRDFIRGLVSAGCSGLLWTPEVRDATCTEDLIRRLQTAVLSPLPVINAWYIRNPPWFQTDAAKNNDGITMADSQEAMTQVRELLRFRKSFVPYLEQAFNHYRTTGKPPFRALVLDWPSDPSTWQIDDQYLIGDRFMATPLTEGQIRRTIYFPEGRWTLYGTESVFEGRQSTSVKLPLAQLPLFQREVSPP
jgi:alpha-D-xyloside xylohydrolase